MGEEMPQQKPSGNAPTTSSPTSSQGGLFTSNFDFEQLRSQFKVFVKEQHRIATDVAQAN